MTAHSRRFARHCREHFGEPADEAQKAAEGTGKAEETQLEQAAPADQDKAS